MEGGRQSCVHDRPSRSSVLRISANVIHESDAKQIFMIENSWCIYLFLHRTCSDNNRKRQAVKAYECRHSFWFLCYTCFRLLFLVNKP